MRTSSPIDSLLAKTTQGLLAATVLQPERWWYLSDLAKHMGRRPSSLQSPLTSLVTAGILRRRREGNRVYFQADPACPFRHELQGILAKTVGLFEVLQDALAPFQSRIVVAFVHGSVASGHQRPASDVDLIVIGTLGLSKLAPVLDAIEERLAPRGQCQHLHRGGVWQETCREEPLSPGRTGQGKALHRRNRG